MINLAFTESEVSVLTSAVLGYRYEYSFVLSPEQRDELNGIIVKMHRAGLIPEETWQTYLAAPTWREPEAA